MKRIVVILLTIMLLIGLNLNTYKSVKGEVVESDAIAEEIVEENNATEQQEVIENNETEIHEATKVETWLEKNLGWVVGIPVGTLITALIEMLYLFKKAREKAQELKETKDVKEFAIEEVKNAKQILETTNVLLNELKGIYDYVLENSTKTKEEIDKLKGYVENRVNDVQNEFTSQFETNQVDLQKNFVELQKMLGRFTAIETIQKMVALNTKELVCTGTAEKIVKMLEGANNEEI